MTSKTAANFETCSVSGRIHFATVDTAGNLSDGFDKLIKMLGRMAYPGAGVDGTPLQELFGFERVFVPAGPMSSGLSNTAKSKVRERHAQGQVGRDQLTDKANGTGLGLTLVKNTVERHGGRIEVDSELGNGATFRVLLPVLVDSKV